MRVKDDRTGRVVLLILAGLQIVFVQAAWATERHVPSQYLTIQNAVDACMPGDVVIVAPGTYYENITMKDNVTVRGSGADVTTIDGGGNGHHVVVFNLASGTISGFKITNSGSTPSYVGGVFASQCSVRVENCIIVNNNSGIKLSSNSTGVIVGNLIMDNLGGAFCEGIEVSHSDATISSNVIAHNSYSGISCKDSSPMIVNNTIYNNGHYGIYCNPISTQLIANNIITHHEYGIMAVGGDESPVPLLDISYNDIWNNSEANYWYEWAVIWPASDYQVDGASGPFEPQPGTGETCQDPFFEDENNYDYHLRAGSLCIDAGDNSVVTEASDPEGNARIVDGDCDSVAVVDMGAYEFGWVYLGDFDGHCDVDLVDFAIMSAAWLSDDTPSANWNQDCDLDNSGVIDMGDLETLGANWLAGVCFSGPASGPDPADGALGINPETELRWYVGGCAVSHNIYFGTSSPGEFQCNQISSTFDPGLLDCERTYYWRVDEVQADSSVIEGDVWRFTTIPPGPAFGPEPADGAADVNTRVELSWSSGNCAVSHNIYFGTSSPGEFQCNQTDTTFDPGALDLGTMYYWRIDEVQADSSVVEGDVWRFTTRSDMLVGRWELDESSGTVASDSVGGHDGTLNGDPVWWPSDGKIGGALEFDGVGDYVEVAGYKGISGSNPRTVSAWVKVESTGSTFSIVRWGTLEINGGLWSNVINADGKLRAAVWGGSVVGGTVINDNTWHHVAIVLPDKEDVKVEDILLYVDGGQESTIISLGSQTIDTAVGMDVLISLDGSVGLLDDVRIYNYALSEGEIGALAGVL